MRRPKSDAAAVLTWRCSPDPARGGRGHRGGPCRVSIDSLSLELAGGTVKGAADAALQAAEDLGGGGLARGVQILPARRLQLPTLGACTAKGLFGQLRLQTRVAECARCRLHPLCRRRKLFLNWGMSWRPADVPAPPARCLRPKHRGNSTAAGTCSMRTSCCLLKRGHLPFWVRHGSVSQPPHQTQPIWPPLMGRGGGS